MAKIWNDPDQPLIFAIGPLTGYFPLMSKTVCAFKSPYSAYARAILELGQEDAP